MQMNFLPVLTLTALMGLSGPSLAAAPADTADVPLTLSGCVIAGEAKDSYLLTNVVIDGTSLAPANAFYRFNTTEGLKSHVGHRVEVASLEGLVVGLVGRPHGLDVDDLGHRWTLPAQRRPACAGGCRLAAASLRPPPRRGLRRRSSATVVTVRPL